MNRDVKKAVIDQGIIVTEFLEMLLEKNLAKINK